MAEAVCNDCDEVAAMLHMTPSLPDPWTGLRPCRNPIADAKHVSNKVLVPVQARMPAYPVPRFIQTEFHPCAQCVVIVHRTISGRE